MNSRKNCADSKSDEQDKTFYEEIKETGSITLKKGKFNIHHIR